MNFTDFRLKLRHFVRKYKKIIFIIVITWLVVFFINQALKLYKPKAKLETTYEPHVSVVNPSEKVPTELQNPIEDMIEKYLKHCNNNEFKEAYNMLSKDCKEYAFGGAIENLREYVLTKMPTPKNYSIQNYSNTGNKYIYEVRYTDDILATGLTNSSYTYTQEKMAFEKLSDGTIEMSVGGFFGTEDIKTVTENDYIKIDIKKRIKMYETERYIVKLTNRTNNTIVIADRTAANEIALALPNEYRNAEIEREIVLNPNQSKEVEIVFSKYVDDGDKSVAIYFNNIRVLENYSGSEASEEVRNAELANAIAKFSIQLSVNN